jgi:calcium-binding protein CML
VDGDGQLSPSNKLTMVASAISPPQERPQEVVAMVNELDTDCNGYVDLGEFASFHVSGKRELDAELLDAFDVNDFNRDADILVAKLGNFLEDIGKGVREDGCLGRVLDLLHFGLFE